MRLLTALAAFVLYAAPASAQCSTAGTYRQQTYTPSYSHQTYQQQQYAAPAYVPVATAVYVVPGPPTATVYQTYQGYTPGPVQLTGVAYGGFAWPLSQTPPAGFQPAFAPPPGFKLVPVDPAGK